MGGENHCRIVLNLNMARYSSAYSRLILRLKEIDTILSMTQDIASRRQNRDNLARSDALCRSGIVLLCSHLEGYIEDLGSLAIRRIEEESLPKTSMSHAFRYYLSRDLIDDINRTTNPLDIATRVDTLLSRDGHIWDSSTSFAPPLPIDMFIRSFATPNHESIRRFFRRFGYARFPNELGAHLRQDYMPCIAMVNHVVDQRNKIAHGDFVTAGAPSDLRDMYRLVKIYCRGTDSVVGNWFRGHGCSIR